MTLGPDRLTQARWLRTRGPLFYPDGDGAASGESASTGGAAGTGAAGTTGKTDGDGKGDGKTGGKPDDKSHKAVTVEIEGKQYVLQDHVNDLVGTARTEGEKRGKDAVEQAAKEKALKEQGDYKALFDEAEKKRIAAEQERDEERLTNLRRKVGERHGLSLNLSDRLKGANEKELETDAKSVAEELGIDATDKSKRKAPDTESGQGSKTRAKSAAGTSTTDGSGTERKQRRPFAFQSEGDVKRWSTNG